MSIKDVADGLVAQCRKGDFLGAVDRFYGDDIVSIEPVGGPDMPAEIRGKEAVRRKGEWWEQNFEVHNVEVNGPYIGDREFAVRYMMDVTNKTNGERTQMTEMALYQVDDDRIVREQFFYNAPGSA